MEPTALGFISRLSLTANPFLLFSALLLVGIVAGEVVRRTRVLPAVAGYLLAGILLGPNVLSLFDANSVHALRPFVEIALALILFELGTRLDFRWLHHDPGLLLTGLAEVAVSFVFMFAVLIALHVEPLFAAFAAAIGVSTSPTVVLLVARELRAEGQVTKRTFTLTAINNVAALLLVFAFLPFVRFELEAPWLLAVAHSFYLLVGSVVLAFIVHVVSLAVALLIGKARGPQAVLQIAAILLALGAAKSLDLSVLFCVLALGLLRRNLDRRYMFADVELGWVGHAFFIVLFVFTGANLQWEDIRSAWPLALAFVAARYAGKSLPVLAFSRSSGLSIKQGASLSLTLMPMAGLAIGLSYEITDLYPDVGFKMTSVLLAAIAMLYLTGPLAVWLGLRWAGEAQPREVR